MFVFAGQGDVTAEPVSSGFLYMNIGQISVLPTALWIPNGF
ncbi:hypothetical protein FRAHR75_330052 [Frankia sp. Hr75.2]|nr:hypothetical protein FRAHR75_330052 [Frankia sp. Hr75.2]